jgi:predicted RNA binding protein YcfA (HicA-like mRNA interferase family)
VADLPVVSGEEAVKALSRIGYRPVRQRGSHVRLKCAGRKSVTVPMKKELKRGLLSGILKDAGLTAEDFVGLL